MCIYNIYYCEFLIKMEGKEKKKNLNKISDPLPPQMLSTSFKWYCYSVAIYYRKITIIIIIIERIIIKNDNEEIKVKRS